MSNIIRGPVYLKCGFIKYNGKPCGKEPEFMFGSYVNPDDIFYQCDFHGNQTCI